MVTIAKASGSTLIPCFNASATDFGNIWLISSSVLAFSAINSLVLSATMASKLLEYFSSWKIILIDINFISNYSLYVSVLWNWTSGTTYQLFMKDPTIHPLSDFKSTLRWHLWHYENTQKITCINHGLHILQQVIFADLVPIQILHTLFEEAGRERLFQINNTFPGMIINFWK